MIPKKWTSTLNKFFDTCKSSKRILSLEGFQKTDSKEEVDDVEDKEDHSGVFPPIKS